MSYLAGPVNTLADFQVEFNGLLMGPGTPYDVPPVWDFLDLGALKTMDQARDWADGSWSGPDFADVLLPQMDVEVFAPDAITFSVLSKLGGGGVHIGAIYQQPGQSGAELAQKLGWYSRLAT